MRVGGGARPYGPRGHVTVLAPALAAIPPWACAALAEGASDEHRLVRTAQAAYQDARRSRPVLVVLDARADLAGEATRAIRVLKADAYTAVVPCVALAGDDPDALLALLDAGADEVLAPRLAESEGRARIALAVRRSQRDLAAQPTTRLPAAGAIERDIARRLAADEPFAACYADLDHFKEFNDRYGYHEGDRVIRMLARVLYDAAMGVAGDRALVGHIGGDDFMVVVPLEAWQEVCDLALETFDTFVPLQYSSADRRAGYYFGKDRRGQLHRVPLMTLSIGVATTERRRYRHAADVSRLASEMKSFAKGQPGSLYALDRRSDDDAPDREAGLRHTTL